MCRAATNTVGIVRETPWWRRPPERHSYSEFTPEYHEGIRRTAGSSRHWVIAPASVVLVAPPAVPLGFHWMKKKMIIGENSTWENIHSESKRNEKRLPWPAEEAIRVVWRVGATAEAVYLSHFLDTYARASNVIYRTASLSPAPPIAIALHVTVIPAHYTAVPVHNIVCATSS